MRRQLAWLLLLLLLVAPARAQEEESREHNANEMDKPAYYGYMISDFFHQRYQDGPVPVWNAAAVLLGVDLLLLLDLWRRRGWQR